MKMIYRLITMTLLILLQMKVPCILKWRLQIEIRKKIKKGKYVEIGAIDLAHYTSHNGYMSENQNQKQEKDSETASPSNPYTTLALQLIL